MSYDACRILNDEKLVFGGVTYDFVRGIDNNGNLSQLTYPGSASFPATTAVSFGPNALGQPGLYDEIESPGEKMRILDGEIK